MYTGLGGTTPTLTGLMVGIGGGACIVFAYSLGLWRIWRFDSAGAWVSTIATGAQGEMFPYLRIQKVGTALRFLASQNGRRFHEFAITHRQTVGVGQHLTSLDRIGLISLNTYVSLPYNPTFEFFRVTEP